MTDNIDEMKINSKIIEQREDRNIPTSGEKMENHPCFQQPTREELNGTMQHFQPFRDELHHHNEEQLAS